MATGPLFFVSIDAIALVATTAKTIFEYATPAGGGMTPVKWWLGGDSVASTDKPIKVEIGRFSSAVTTATTVTPSLGNYGHNGIAAKGTAKHSCTSEGAGTASDVEIHRISPLVEYGEWVVLGNELMVPASGFFRIRCTAPTSNVNVNFGIWWQE